MHRYVYPHMWLYTLLMPIYVHLKNSVMWHIIQIVKRHVLVLFPFIVYSYYLFYTHVFCQQWQNRDCELYSRQNIIKFRLQNIVDFSFRPHCPACRTTFIATRFRVAVICPIIPMPHCIRVFFYFVWFVFINHIFQFYYELCTYCNILDIYLS